MSRHSVDSVKRKDPPELCYLRFLIAIRNRAKKDNALDEFEKFIEESGLKSIWSKVKAELSQQSSVYKFSYENKTIRH